VSRGSMKVPRLEGTGAITIHCTAKQERTLNNRGVGAHSGKIVTNGQLRGLHGGHLTFGQVALVPNHKNRFFGRVLVVS
jgi:hypothetical protein